MPLSRPSRSLLDGRAMVAVDRQGGAAGHRPQPSEIPRERKTCPEQGGNWDPPKADEIIEAISNRVHSPNTQKIQGTYR